MTFALALYLLSLTTAVTCAVPGVFVILRGQSMLIDALSHAVLPGIVIGVALTGSLHSPVMIMTATVMGLLVVWVSHMARTRGLVIGDADQGLVFPVLFAAGVLMLSTVYSHIGISTETVLAGDLNLLALGVNHLVIGSVDLGPAMMWVLLAVLALTVVFIATVYTSLTAATFDPGFATTIGLPVRFVSLTFMVLVALTIVVSFSVAGSILVVALMICPPAAALLVARSIPSMFAWTVVYATASATVGFLIAWTTDIATSPIMAVTAGAFLYVALLQRKHRSNGKHNDDGEEVPEGPLPTPRCSLT